MTPDDHHKRFVAIAELLYGTRPGAKLSKMLHYSPQYMAMVFSGERAVTPEIERRLGALCRLEAVRREHEAYQLTQIAAALLSETSAAEIKETE